MKQKGQARNKCLKKNFQVKKTDKNISLETEGKMYKRIGRLIELNGRRNKLKDIEYET